jgi:diacylglycerol kinase family enzyme
LLTGTWREQPGIRSFTVQQVAIDHARGRTWAATDGELGRENMPLRYALLPRALNVLTAERGA